MPHDGFVINGFLRHARNVEFLNGRLRNIRPHSLEIASSLLPFIDSLGVKKQEAGLRIKTVADEVVAS